MITISPGYKTVVTFTFTDADGNVISRPVIPDSVTPDMPFGEPYAFEWPMADLPGTSYSVGDNTRHGATLYAFGTEPGILRFNCGPYSAALGVNSPDPDPQPVGDVNITLTAADPVPNQKK